MTQSPVFILPGWQNSDAMHWQSLWQAAHGYHRVEQHDWLRPLRGDWIARLEEELLAVESPVVLAAHSLGCIQVAAWAAHSQNAAKVKGALLVAPPDIERPELQHTPLSRWAPIPLLPLPFPSVVVSSEDDPFCELQRSQQFASAWGAHWVNAGPRGHLNAESQLGDWPQGQALLQSLLNR